MGPRFEPPSENRLHILDAFRFFAAIMVVLYHYTARPSGGFPALAEVTQYGYLGVPIFFILSGFVISISAAGRKPFAFLVARAVRLYPALWICSAVTVFLCGAFDGKPLSAFQWLTNLTLMNDYMGQKDVDGVYWTLHVEIKFYGCIFLLLALGIFQKFHLWLSIWLGMTVTHLLTGQPGIMSWFISPGWSPFFIIGVALYLIHQQGLRMFNSTVLLIASAAALFKSTTTTGFVQNPETLDGLVAASVITVAIGAFLLVALGKLHIKPRRNLVIAGAMTYPLYLLHNVGGKAIINAVAPVIPESVAVIAVLGMMVLLSYIVSQYLEPRVANKLKLYFKSIPNVIPVLLEKLLFGKAR